jgi:hypothetical protein
MYIRTIPITKKLGVQTKKPKVLICYDFHFGIFDEEEDMMFAAKLDLISTRTIVVLAHTKLVFKIDCISNLKIAE